jgi:hypothetical protein
MEQEGGLLNIGKKKIRVKVYFSPKDFAEVAKDAEKAGKRRGGLLLFTQKEHGFSNQKVANTDGLSKFLKFCWHYWQETERHRFEKAAELAKMEQDIKMQREKLGV